MDSEPRYTLHSAGIEEIILWIHLALDWHLAALLSYMSVYPIGESIQQIICSVGGSASCNPSWRLASLVPPYP